MLVAATPAQVVFWQWLNQSVNVMCNYVNRSGATVEWSQVGQAYALAVGVSCGIAVGARKLVEAGPPAVKRLGIAVPYAAVVLAGGANVAFTRLPEMQDGVPIADADGNVLIGTVCNEIYEFNMADGKAPVCYIQGHYEEMWGLCMHPLKLEMLANSI